MSQWVEPAPTPALPTPAVLAAVIAHANAGRRAEALRRVLALAPKRAEAWVKLGIVLQDAAQRRAAMAAYGRALRLRPEAFGRITHALASSSHGAVWLGCRHRGSGRRRPGR